MAEPDRNEFLIAMYNQLMNDINRHIVVVWHSIATLVAAIAALGLVEKEIITLDIAASIIVITAVWLVQHVIDASYWYNRNLAIIANIEKQFLLAADQKEIHYYFGAHRPKNKMISHLKIQLSLALMLTFLILIFHSYVVIWPKICDLEVLNFFPITITILGAVWCYNSQKTNNQKYAEFIIESPGKYVDNSDVKYGIGHGFQNENK